MACDSGTSYGGSTAGDHEVSLMYGAAVNEESVLGGELVEGGHVNIAGRHIRPPGSAMGLRHQGISIRLRLLLAMVLHKILVSISVCVGLMYITLLLCEFTHFVCVVPCTSHYYDVSSHTSLRCYYVNSYIYRFELTPFQLRCPNPKSSTPSLMTRTIFLAYINASSTRNHE